jgi:hypothetical protein
MSNVQFQYKVHRKQILKKKYFFIRINMFFLVDSIHRMRGKSMAFFPLKNHRRIGIGFPSTEHGKRRCSPFL